MKLDAESSAGGDPGAHRFEFRSMSLAAAFLPRQERRPAPVFFHELFEGCRPLRDSQPVAGSFLSQLCGQLDQFMLGVLLPPEHLGWYSTAISLREGLRIVPESISVVLFPARRRRSIQSRRCHRTSLPGESLRDAALSAAVMPALVAHPAMGRIYGGENFCRRSARSIRCSWRSCFNPSPAC